MKAVALSSIQVSTFLYTREHVSQPRGHGSWAFSIGDRAGYDNPDKVFWADGLYSQAVRQAKIEAQKQGKEKIYVLP
ncbi:MAG: hypothetical protein MJZ26_09250 [Fibrobacter sp.]|nr:hypothetical protein [Fibrobacter sp.]